MRYFQLDTLGDFGNKKLAIVSERVPELGIYSHYPARGKPITDRYPADARTHLQPGHRGTKLSSLVGNTFGWLIVSTEFKESIVQNSGPIEILPLAIYNHKKRLHSADYWVINPLGSIDCVDRDKSAIVYLDDTKADVVGVDKFVFRKDRLEKAPGIFRVLEAPTAYFINQTLARSLKDKDCTNIFIDEIDVV